MYYAVTGVKSKHRCKTEEKKKRGGKGEQRQNVKRNVKVKKISHKRGQKKEKKVEKRK